MTRFTMPWNWDGSPVELRSRAADDTGAAQPTRTEWKQRYAPSNYNHNNAIQAWSVNAEGAVENVYT